MSRETYPTTQETRTVLTDNVKKIAEEMEVDPSHLHHLLAGDESDCFGKFRRLFAAAVRAGADVNPWLASLESIQNKHSGKDLHRCIADNALFGADTTAELIAAIQDGEIDDREASRIRLAIQKHRSCLNELDGLLTAQVAPVSDMREWARTTVGTRRRVNGNGAGK